MVLALVPRMAVLEDPGDGEAAKTVRMDQVVVGIRKCKCKCNVWNLDTLESGICSEDAASNGEDIRSRTSHRTRRDATDVLSNPQWRLSRRVQSGKIMKQENAEDSGDDEGAATQQQHRQQHLPSLSRGNVAVMK